MMFFDRVAPKNEHTRERKFKKMSAMYHTTLNLSEVQILPFYTCRMLQFLCIQPHLLTQPFRLVSDALGKSHFITHTDDLLCVEMIIWVVFSKQMCNYENTEHKICVQISFPVVAAPV